MTESTLAALRKKADKSQDKADEDRAALLKAAVAEAVTSHAYGHLTAVAREAGIAAPYLRELVEKEHPGWLDEAARKREAEREQKNARRGRGRGSKAAA